MAIGNEAGQSHRLFNCAACGQAVHICRACDRGNLYCAGGCASTRRTESLRRAGARYQHTRGGATRHAARQSAWRARHRQGQEVTHQGSARAGLAVTVPAVVCEDSEGDDASDNQSGSGMHARLAIGAIVSHASRARVGAFACGFCRRLLSAWIRIGPLGHAR